ncbi:hypothetical protein [Aestuariivirga sp.]|uniref:hypothetical protein n=1 Tax=Aestuariivirga sp. TaxID=2650926 RepID=UPI0035942535
MTNEAKKPKYVSNDELREVFSDMITAVGFDGGNFRIELSVSRASQTQNGRETTVHPVTRLVLPLHVAGELLQKLGGALADLERQGVVKKGMPPDQGAQSYN